MVQIAGIDIYSPETFEEANAARHVRDAAPRSARVLARRAARPRLLGADEVRRHHHRLAGLSDVLLGTRRHDHQRPVAGRLWR